MESLEWDWNDDVDSRTSGLAGERFADSSVSRDEVDDRPTRGGVFFSGVMAAPDSCVCLCNCSNTSCKRTHKNYSFPLDHYMKVQLAHLLQISNLQETLTEPAKANLTQQKAGPLTVQVGA